MKDDTIYLAEHMLSLELRTVLEFHRKFRFPVSDEPTHLTAEHLAERHTYMAEELEEFRTASLSQDMVKMLDALLDLDVFLKGTIVRMGLQHAWMTAHLAVHRANMSKEVGVGHRGFATDLVKPPGWESPDNFLAELLENVGYKRSAWFNNHGEFVASNALSAALVDDGMPR